MNTFRCRYRMPLDSRPCIKELFVIIDCTGSINVNLVFHHFIFVNL
jgi:hypothetical protein